MVIGSERKQEGSKREQNIFCYCSFFICIGLSRPNTLPQWNIFGYCRFVVCIGPNTLPKWNIFCYCSLFSCIGLSRPNTLPKWKIFPVIVACLYVLAFQDQTPFQSEIFSESCYCWLVPSCSPCSLSLPLAPLTPSHSYLAPCPHRGGGDPKT